MVVPGAPGASCAVDPSVAARGGSATSPASEIERFKTGKRKRSRKKKNRAPSAKAESIGLKADQEDAIRRRLRGNHAPLYDRDGRPQSFVCSEPWIDAQFKRFVDRDPENKEIVYRFHDPAQFPPGGPQTTMRRCRVCGRVTPPQCVSARGRCLDCQYGGMSPAQLKRLPSSPGVIDMGRLKATRRRGEEAS